MTCILFHVKCYVRDKHFLSCKTLVMFVMRILFHSNHSHCSRCVISFIQNVCNVRETHLYYIVPVVHTHNKMFIFLTNDKPVIRIVQYGIIFLLLLNKQKNIFLIFINLKLIQALKNSVHRVQSYIKIYLTYIRQILKTSTISFI